MPVVTIFPKSREIEDNLEGLMIGLRPVIKGTICRISGFPEHEVIVGLSICLMRDADPIAADIELEVKTCPHEELEARSDELCDALAQLFIANGLSVNRLGEAWVQFRQGSWCQFKDGQITDRVSHYRKIEEAHN